MTQEQAARDEVARLIRCSRAMKRLLSAVQQAEVAADEMVRVAYEAGERHTDLREAAVEVRTALRKLDESDCAKTWALNVGLELQALAVLQANRMVGTLEPA